MGDVPGPLGAEPGTPNWRSGADGYRPCAEPRSTMTPRRGPPPPPQGTYRAYQDCFRDPLSLAISARKRSVPMIDATHLSRTSDRNQ
jgi:hypothetical protein